MEGCHFKTRGGGAVVPVLSSGVGTQRFCSMGLAVNKNEELQNSPEGNWELSVIDWGRAASFISEWVLLRILDPIVVMSLPNYRGLWFKLRMVLESSQNAQKVSLNFLLQRYSRNKGKNLLKTLKAHFILGISKPDPEYLYHKLRVSVLTH